MKVLFHLAGRACVGNARRLKVFYHLDDMLDPLPSCGGKRIGAQELISGALERPSFEHGELLERVGRIP
jgi:hypothetical protein